MGIFSKKPSQAELTRNQFDTACKSMPWWRALANTIGIINATYVAGLVWEKTAGTQPKLVGIQADTQTLDENFKHELRQIQGRKLYVGELLGQAKQGLLRTRLAAATETEANYYTAPVNPSRAYTPAQLELGKAWKWLTKSWQGGGANKVMYELNKYVNQNQGIPGLGVNEHIILDNVYKEIVTGAPAVRGPNFMLNYPSSVGGKYLLKWIFQITSNIAWPANGDPKWEDWALFYSGAIVSVQGFTDGNKRMGRFAYAVLMLKGGRPFKAPTVALENNLHNMTMG